MIPFTRRELTRAWRDAQSASQAECRGNPHRLLLFYAAECGLKAVYLKQNSLEFIDGEVGRQLSHDLNRVMGLLRISNAYFLPSGLKLPPIKQKDRVEKQRNCEVGELNQVWRYGGVLMGDADKLVEQQLEKINGWIAEEIR